MKSMKRLWIAFALVMVLSFLVLGWIGTRIYQEMPPLPAKVVTTEGTVLVDEGEIQAGQNVWQSLGGMEVGSVFWIATAWLAAGLFIGPLVSEHEPRGQRLGVNVLFLALLLVVVGSLTGEWLSVHNKLSDTTSFYFGHQGYEYVDLGRVWQIALFIGLLLWLLLMVRVLLPALRRPGEQRQLVALLAVASGAIALFYGAGLT